MLLRADGSVLVRAQEFEKLAIIEGSPLEWPAVAELGHAGHVRRLDDGAETLQPDQLSAPAGDDAVTTPRPSSRCLICANAETAVPELPLESYLGFYVEYYV
jgi:hypothetical protein